jgi:predicted hydrocarbon binding protein
MTPKRLRGDIMLKERKIDNFTMRIYLETIENIVGSNGLKSILNYAHLKKYIDSFPPDNDDIVIPREDLHSLYGSLLDLFGNTGARSLQFQVGHNVFRTGVEKRPGIVKALKLTARLLPETKRMRLALEKFVEGFEERFSQVETRTLELEETNDYFLIVDTDCYMSEGITSKTPVCGVYVGMVRALIEWITGHEHAVEEIKCRAMGDSADVIRIAKSRK